MNTDLERIRRLVYDKCQFELTSYKEGSESKEYNACKFELNGKIYICRSAKTTPKKSGQFVTFWKRNKDKIIEPYKESDNIDFFIINVRKEGQFGQFVFPKTELVKRSIITTNIKEGKRGFRVYPPWDTVKSRQATDTQNWQIIFFYTVNNFIDLKKVKLLYK